MLSVANELITLNIIMLSVIMLNIIMLSILVSLYLPSSQVNQIQNRTLSIYLYVTIIPLLLFYQELLPKEPRYVKLRSLGICCNASPRVCYIEIG